MFIFEWNNHNSQAYYYGINFLIYTIFKTKK